MIQLVVMNWNDIKTVLVLQPENPDGDSVASSLALEEILGDQGKDVIIVQAGANGEYIGRLDLYW